MVVIYENKLLAYGYQPYKKYMKNYFRMLYNFQVAEESAYGYQPYEKYMKNYYRMLHKVEGEEVEGTEDSDVSPTTPTTTVTTTPSVLTGKQSFCEKYK